MLTNDDVSNNDMSATLSRKKVTRHGKNVNMSARHETTCRRHDGDGVAQGS
jgi:hypothetical protein